MTPLAQRMEKPAALQPVRSRPGRARSEGRAVTDTPWSRTALPTSSFGQRLTSRSSPLADAAAAQAAPWEGLGLTDPESTGQAVPNSHPPEKMALELK